MTLYDPRLQLVMDSIYECECPSFVLNGNELDLSTEEDRSILAMFAHNYDTRKIIEKFRDQLNFCLEQSKPKN